MSRLPSSKTAKVWAERIAQCERSNVPVAQFCQSIGCSPTFFFQWKRKTAGKPQTSTILRVQTLESAKGHHRDQTPLPESTGIPIFVPISAVKSIAAILEQVEKLGDYPWLLVKSFYVPSFPRNRMPLAEALEVDQRLLGELRHIRAV